MKLSPAQKRHLARLVTDPTPIQLLHGPVGTAKTTTAVLWLLTESARCTGRVFGLLAPTKDQLVGGPIRELKKMFPSTRQTKIDDDGNKVWTLPSRIGGNNFLRCFSASRAGDAARIRAHNLAGGIADEVTLIPDDAFAAFVARSREGGHPNPKIVGSTNPDGPGHWVHDMFIADSQSGMTSHIETAHSDNPALPVDYVDRLNAVYMGAQKERMVEGRWVSATGAAFPWLARSIVFAGPDPNDVIGVDIGMDVGWSSVTHAVRSSRTTDGRTWIDAEWVMDHTTAGPLEDHKKVDRVLTSLAPPDGPPLLTFTIDRSAVAAIAHASRIAPRHTQVYAAHDNHADGVQIVESWAAVDAISVVAPGCPVAAREIPKIVFSLQGSLVGREELDPRCVRHGVDAIRYMIATRHIMEHGGFRAWDNWRRCRYAIRS